MSKTLEERIEELEATVKVLKRLLDFQKEGNWSVSITLLNNKHDIYLDDEEYSKIKD